MAKQRNGQSSIYKGKDGYWHGRVTVGIRDDGRADRRHVMSTNKATVTAKVRALEKDRGAGLLTRATATGSSVALDVIRGNPAITLYRRLGFRSVGEDQEKFQMLWRPAAPAEPP